ncbi:MAG: hypothetical protein ACE5OP_06090 [Candidatus Glassbacteria bacterium]
MSIKKMFLAMTMLLMVLMMFSSVDANAQVMVHKQGRPWEVDSKAVPDDGVNAPIGAGVITKDGAGDVRETINPGSGVSSRSDTAGHYKAIEASEPMPASFVVRELFSVFLFLLL